MKGVSMKGCSFYFSSYTYIYYLNYKSNILSYETTSNIIYRMKAVQDYFGCAEVFYKLFNCTHTAITSINVCFYGKILYQRCKQNYKQHDIIILCHNAHFYCSRSFDIPSGYTIHIGFS